MNNDFEMPPFLQDESTREYMKRHTANHSPAPPDAALEDEDGIDAVENGGDDGDGGDYTLPGQKRHPQPPQPPITFNTLYGNRKIKTTWTPGTAIIAIILAVIVIILAFTSLSS